MDNIFFKVHVNGLDSARGPCKYVSILSRTPNVPNKCILLNNTMNGPLFRAPGSTFASPLKSRTLCCLSWRLWNPAWMRWPKSTENHRGPWRAWQTRSGQAQGSDLLERSATAKWQTRTRTWTLSRQIMRSTSFQLLRILCVFDGNATDWHCEITSGQFFVVSFFTKYFFWCLHMWDCLTIHFCFEEKVLK